MAVGGLGGVGTWPIIGHPELGGRPRALGVEDFGKLVTLFGGGRTTSGLSSYACKAWVTPAGYFLLKEM